MGTLNKDPKSKGTSKRGIHFNPGDVLFGKLRPYLKNWLFARFEGVAVGDFWVLTSSKIDHGFTYSLIQAPGFQYIANLSSGSKMPRSDWGLVSNARTFIPTNLSEQESISSVLFGLDTTITLHEEKKRQLERLKSALMQKMFADKSGYPAVRFNGFCDEWKKQKLGDIVETITDYVAAGSFASLRENVIYRSEPCYAQLIRTADLKSNFSKIAPVYVDKQAFDFLYRVSLDKESVILPNIGNCGEVYYVDPHELPYMRNVLGPNAILIRSSSLNNHFLSILFQSHNFQKSLKLIISPNGQTKFNKTELKRIKMVLPMDVNEQNSLSAFFKMINTAISLQEHKSNILKELKSSLLQNMFI
ncbi:restriction endonuclease subunit S [Lactobacillus delbrueckii]